MLYIRRSESRGNVDFGWLRSRHSFSFGHYYDPKHMGFSVLRVINDDQVVAGAGFDTHGHRDMEIISYVIEGALTHKDSQGNTFTLTAGEVQRMSVFRHPNKNLNTQLTVTMPLSEMQRRSSHLHSMTLSKQPYMLLQTGLSQTSSLQRVLI